MQVHRASTALLPDHTDRRSSRIHYYSQLCFRLRDTLQLSSITDRMCRIGVPRKLSSRPERQRRITADLRHCAERRSTGRLIEPTFRPSPDDKIACRPNTEALVLPIERGEDDWPAPKLKQEGFRPLPETALRRVYQDYQCSGFDLQLLVFLPSAMNSNDPAL